jgi:pyrroline-5-carboxylate reductase
MDKLGIEKFALIGGGAMGGAIVAGLLARGLICPEKITVSDMDAGRGAQLHEMYGLLSTTDNAAAIAGADIVVLAVKPQVLPRVMAELHGRIPSQALTLSIVAGATIDLLTEGLGHPSVVRVMPNTPAQVGEGMAVWMATQSVSSSQRELAQTILRALGEETYVTDEKYLDMATALSGSGPAYVLLFLEAMVEAGVYMGFARPIAEKLAWQTMWGTLALIRERKQHPAVLRNQVTSPGGTTAEALQVFERGGLRAVVTEAVQAAFQKAQELGAKK